MEADVQFDADRAFARLVFVHQRNQCAAEAVSLLDEQLAESANAVIEEEAFRRPGTACFPALQQPE